MLKERSALWMVTTVVTTLVTTVGCSSPEEPETDSEEVLDLASIPVPPADGPPLVALRSGVIVRAAPEPAGKPLGTLTVGARVPRAEAPVTTKGCEGGWYPIHPRGFVCAGPEATTETDSEAVRVLGSGPNMRRALPFRYGRVVSGAAVSYGTVPTRAEQAKAEPKLGSQKVAPVERVGAGSNDVPLDDDLHPAGLPVVMPEGEGVGEDGYRTTESWFLFDDTVPLAEGTTLLAGHPSATQTRVLKRRSGVALLGTFVAGSESPRRFGVMPNGRFIPIDRLEPDLGATWHGFDMTKAELPVAFTLRRGVRGWELEKSKATKIDEHLQPGQPVDLTGRFRTVNRLKFFETTEKFWVRHKDLIVIYPRNKYPDWARADQKWIDVSLANQTMVAYLGRKPQMATLISSGQERLGDPQTGPSTMQGVFRLRSKHITADVDDREVGQAYSIHDAPWVLEFAEGFSITGSYWREVFGEARSYHNVALAPVDALWLWHFSDPQLPEGWHSVNIDEESADNTIVYVHK